jgi:hypothetical protein
MKSLCVIQQILLLFVSQVFASPEVYLVNLNKRQALISKTCNQQIPDYCGTIPRTTFVQQCSQRALDSNDPVLAATEYTRQCLQQLQTDCPALKASTDSIQRSLALKFCNNINSALNANGGVGVSVGRSGVDVNIGGSGGLGVSVGGSGVGGVNSGGLGGNVNGAVSGAVSGRAITGGKTDDTLVRTGDFETNPAPVPANPSTPAAPATNPENPGQAAPVGRSGNETAPSPTTEDLAGRAAVGPTSTCDNLPHQTHNVAGRSTDPSTNSTNPSDMILDPAVAGRSGVGSGIAETGYGTNGAVSSTTGRSLPQGGVSSSKADYGKQGISSTSSDASTEKAVSFYTALVSVLFAMLAL